MKKLFSQIFLSSVVFISSNMLLAQESDFCPPISMIRSMSLSMIDNCGTVNPYLWCAYPNQFNYQNQEWSLQIIFVAPDDGSPQKLTPEEALKIGQEKFRTAAFFDKPLASDPAEGTHLKCLYSNSLFILAFSPPIGVETKYRN